MGSFIILSQAKTLDDILKFIMRNFIVLVFIGVFHHTVGQGYFPDPYFPNGCECSDFTFYNGIETVGDCLTGQDYGFCYVHIPTSCPDGIESETFRNELNPEYSMYVSVDKKTIFLDKKTNFLTRS